MGRLRILTEGVEPAVLELPGGVATLGRREDSPLRLAHDSVSGRHCDLAEADGLLTILDHGSTNGTFIKGERTGQGTVAAGETFRLGGVELRYEVDSPSETSTPAIAAVEPAPAPALVPTSEPPQLKAPKLVAPPAPSVAAASTDAPKLSPAEALKQSLAKAASVPAAATAPSPAPDISAPQPVRPPVVSPPVAAPVKPGTVKPPEPGAVPKFTLGGHKPAEPAPASAPPAPPAPPKPGGSKLVPTGEPSRLTLGSSHKSAPEPAAAVPAPEAIAPAAPTPPPAVKGGKACTRHPANAALYVCKKCRELACDSCSPTVEIAGKHQHFCPVCRNLCQTLAEKEALDAKALTREGQTFMQRLPGVFKYPFNKNGIMFLVVGTVVFVALDFASRFSLKIAIVGIGYLFAYMQKIVRSSAEAEDELPGFPEVSEWRSELLQPFLLLTWTFVVSFGPAFGYMAYHTFADTEMSLPVLFPLFALGFLYFPMALLAVAMSGSYLAVNPLVVLPAITRLNLEYVGATLVFFGLVTARYLSETLVRAIVPVPVLPTLLGGFLALYFLACEMRLLGLIYYEHKKKLGWFSF